MKWPGLIAALFLTCHVSAQAAPVAKSPDGKREYHTGLLKLPPSFKGFGQTHVTLEDCANLPENFDLRDLGVVPDVRDQGSCGSCWAFSKTASLESATKANGGAMLNLAEQELVSCDRNNYGCNGGLLNQNEYQVSHGQSLETDFPYKARDVSCKSGLHPAAKALRFVNVPTDQKQLQCALFKSHTIPWVTVAAGGDWGNFPSDLKPITRCGDRGTNHAVGIVGWKTIGGKVYFIMRNSWGTGWGAKGYALMSLGCDELGDELAYVMTNEMPCKPPVPHLPIEVLTNPGDEIVLAVKPEDGVSYGWLKGAAPAGNGPTLVVTATDAEQEYTVTATNSCGTGTSKTKVKTISAFEP